MKDMMIDIETLGTPPGSVITQIGACYFDRVNGDIGQTFSENIGIQSCLSAGLQVDEGAMRFWYEHKPSWLLNPVHLLIALQELRTFASDAHAIWSHATFDIPMIAAAAAKFDVFTHPDSRQVLPYWKCRDLRTLADLAHVKKPKDQPLDNKEHDGLKDCLYQVTYFVTCHTKLMGGKK